MSSTISALGGLGSSVPYQETEPNAGGNGFYSAFEQLASALQSGNLTEAQQAYSSLASMMPSAQSGAAGSPASGQASSSFASIGRTR